MPDPNEHLPDRIEACVHRAGLELQRRLFRALLETADHELVLQRRHGKGSGGIRRRGTRPFTFTTIVGEVTVERPWISHTRDDTREVRRRPPGAHRTNWPSRGASATRPVIRCSTDRRGRVAPTSAGTPTTRACWGGARSWRSCTRKASDRSPLGARGWGPIGFDGLGAIGDVLLGQQTGRSFLPRRYPDPHNWFLLALDCGLDLLWLLGRFVGPTVLGWLRRGRWLTGRDRGLRLGGRLRGLRWPGRLDFTRLGDPTGGPGFRGDWVPP